MIASGSAVCVKRLAERRRAKEENYNIIGPISMNWVALGRQTSNYTIERGELPSLKNARMLLGGVVVTIGSNK